LSSSCEQRPLRLGVAGLGRGFMLTLPSLKADSRVILCAAAAPRAESRSAFEEAFGGRAHDSVESLCADPDVEAVYIATPHQMHAQHVACAAEHGKHVLVDKPLAIELADGQRMVAAARASGIHLIVGPSHSFDAPVQQAHDIIRSGELGEVRMIQALNYTDFLYRPRRPEELRTEAGGGVMFSQAIHQIDIVRLLAGGLAQRVMAMTGAWDPERPTEGAYAAMIDFACGAFATLTYSGYAHFDSDEWMDWVGELGHAKVSSEYGGARRALAGVHSPEDEAALKSDRTFGAAEPQPAAPHHEHFGPVIVCCERGDLRLTPKGVWLYGDTERRFIRAPDLAAPRLPVIDALFAAIRDGAPPAQTGEWGLASLELCHAILRAAELRAPVELELQVPA